MHSLLITILPIALWVIAAFQLFFIVLSLLKFRKTGEILFLLTGLVAVGLFYDSLMLSLGGILPDSQAFKAFSQLRFISHGALIPLLFPISGYGIRLKKKPMMLLWIFTGLLILAGVLEGIFTSLELKSVAGVIRYASGELTPGWAKTISSLLSYGTVVPLMAAGVYVIIKDKTPSLFLSGFLMFAFAALGPATGNFDLIFFISMFGEVCMILFFYIFAQYRSKKQ